MKFRIPALTAILILASTAMSYAEESGVRLTEADLPTTKPGLWRRTMTVNGRAKSPVAFCDDGGRVSRAPDDPTVKCDPADVVRRPDGSYWVHRTCQVGKYRNIITQVIRGDPSRRYTVDGDIDLGGGLTPKIVGHDEFEFLGPCRATAKD